MEQNQEGMTVNEVLGDALQTYITVEDAMLLRNTFKDNPRLQRVLNKVFLPTIQDPEMTPESMAEDFWMSGKNWDAIPADECKALVVARQEAIKYIMGGLIRIKAISSVNEEDIQQGAQRRKKDSAK